VPLSPSHEELLRASAIAPEIAQERGYSTITEPRDLTLEGYADWQALTPGVLVPMYDVIGANGSSQFRPDTPRLRDGKAVKYETPEGSNIILDVHPSRTQFLKQPDTALLITEGVRKADALTSLGYCTVALSGVWNWRNKNGALGDWEDIALKDRYVWIVYDSDARTNHNVREAIRRLSEFLLTRGTADVKVALPPSNGSAKVGIDDYLAAGGSLQDVLASALPVEQQLNSWEPIDLTTLAEVEPVLPDLAPSIKVLYPGKRHIVSGPPESLKTLITYALLLDALRDGKKVAVVDFENGPHDARNLFRDLSATDDELRQVCFISPDMAASEADVQRLISLGIDVVLIDAGAGLYSLEGADDNSRMDVEAVSQKYVTPLWRSGITVVGLDHVSKNKPSGWAIGSERKVGGVEVHLQFESKVTLTRGGSGVVRVYVHKDRPGYIRHEYGVQGFELHIDSDSETHALTFAAPRTIEDSTGDFRPTALMEKVSKYIEAHEGQSKQEVYEALKPSKRVYVWTAFEKLETEGFIAFEKIGRTMYARHVAPFREHDEVFNIGSAD
jgi:hypothetical protein